MSSLPLPSLPTVDSLKRAVELAGQIEKLQAELVAILGSKAPKAAGKPGRRGRPAKAVSADSAEKPKRQMSEAARARIVAAQKKRWAKIKKEKKAEAKGEG
jgi:hypothetical protein